MKRRDFLRSSALATGAMMLPSTAVEAKEKKKQQQESDGKAGAIEAYTGTSPARSGMALGGIGSGFFEIRKDGRFYCWNIFNNYPKETGPYFSLPSGEQEDRISALLFFEVRYQVEGEQPRMKLLQISPSLMEGALMGIAYTFPWMKAVDQIEYEATFPVATLRFTDETMPFDVEMKAWSSFIPHDVKNSSLPLVFFDFTLTPKVEKKVTATILMSARNCAGYDTPSRSYVTQIDHAADHTIVTMSAGEMDTKASSWGEISIASLSPTASYYAGWGALHPYYEQALRDATLPNLDDTNGYVSLGEPIPAWMPRTRGRNHIDPKTGKPIVHDQDLYATVAHTCTVTPHGGTQSARFQYAWNFPNLYGNSDESKRTTDGHLEGHYYSNFFNSARDVTLYGKQQHDALLARTLEFQRNFFDSDADPAVLSQVNSQLNTFFTSGRLVKDGSFGILEGLSATWSWGPIATIDVMYYGTAPIIALFPELQKATMRCHARVQAPSGEICHGLQKDFHAGEDATADVTHRIDLPGEFVQMVLRDFFWTNDRKYLEDLYPHVQRAVEYVLRQRSGKDGNMPITHKIETSYDNLPMYGYASYLLSQWICAMQSASLAAQTFGDSAAATRYAELAKKTRDRMEETLWDGNYYLLYAGGGVEPERGKACFTDQMAGQWFAHASGLDGMLPPEHIHTAMRTILTRNVEQDIGLKNCTLRPNDPLPEIPPLEWVNQSDTTWTGVELAFASFLMYEGMYAEGLAVTKNVDTRYRKNGLYWNHQEFGGHYFRPMSAWSLINAQLGFSLQCGRMTFDPKLPQRNVKLFFATPDGTAVYRRSGRSVQITCLTGNLRFQEIWMKEHHLSKSTVDGTSLPFTAGSQKEWTTMRFAMEQTLPAGKTLAFS